MLASIFNDVIGPVMRGPSSSHCAAALRIGRLARELTNGAFDEVLIEFDRNGSLPTTHDTQGSDMGLAGGLMGWEPTSSDCRFPCKCYGNQVRVCIETVTQAFRIRTPTASRCVTDTNVAFCAPSPPAAA